MYGLRFSRSRSDLGLGFGFVGCVRRSCMTQETVDVGVACSEIALPLSALEIISFGVLGQRTGDGDR